MMVETDSAPDPLLVLVANIMEYRIWTNPYTGEKTYSFHELVRERAEAWIRTHPEQG